jgi:cysteine-rich repeat protein
METATCNADCTFAACGDGKINASAGETCDDSGESATCNADCTPSSCGDGTLNMTAGEGCDDGANNGDGTTNCTSVCAVTFCGDLYKGPSEGCDDGNAINGDGCSDQCTLESCGNGVVDAGEDCDGMGETVDCNANCTAASCGDGTVNMTAGETCDTGTASASCDVDCTDVDCGDGLINVNAGETCDDGTATGIEGMSDCTGSCLVNSCGDDFVGLTEGCDDGVNTGVEGQSDCTPACQNNACGDGYTGLMEGCDDGNFSNNDNCLNSCVVASCGDGFLNPSTEECEPGVAGDTCESLGFDTGTIDCIGCVYDTSQCSGGGNSCFETDIPALSPQNPNIMMVLDKSGSMFDLSKNWDADNNGMISNSETRWASLYSVTEALFTNFETKVNFGVQLFPYAQAINAYACSVGAPEPDLGLHTTAELLADMPAETTVGGDAGSFGATPTREGLLSAYGSLTVTTLPGEKAVILITDGAANCSAGTDGFPLTADSFDIFDNSVDGEITSALNSGISTYVVGIAIENMTVNDGPGGEPNNVNTYDILNGYAQSGGTALMGGPPYFYNTQNQAQLLSDIQDVLNSLQSCFVDLPFPPLFPDITEVYIGGTLVTPYHQGETDCGTFSTGWVYTDTTYTQIELCGSSCADLGGQGALDVVYKCEGGG